MSEKLKGVMMGAASVAVVSVVVFYFFLRPSPPEVLRTEGSLASYIRSLDGYKVGLSDVAADPGMVVRITGDRMKPVEWSDEAYAEGTAPTPRIDAVVSQLQFRDEVEWNSSVDLSLPGLAGMNLGAAFEAAGIQVIRSEAEDVGQVMISETALRQARLKDGIPEISIHDGSGIVAGVIGARSVRYRFLRDAGLEASAEAEEELSGVLGQTSGRLKVLADGEVEVESPVFAVTGLYTRAMLEGPLEESELSLLAGTLTDLGISVVRSEATVLELVVAPGDLGLVRENIRSSVRATLKERELRATQQQLDVQAERATGLARQVDQLGQEVQEERFRREVAQERADMMAAEARERSAAFETQEKARLRLTNQLLRVSTSVQETERARILRAGRGMERVLIALDAQEFESASAGLHERRPEQRQLIEAALRYAFAAGQRDGARPGAR